ncbi:hypothetical protein [Roseiterribacter gracilis]|uniref:DUF922 domain-containing protein n=1 Tax=Roseiterribacter gracilis TaxID=2812848 RepID=A0A8S8XBK9_9PROT|nr:hypothetical protein TMPK1_16690 [Rhodospirillales bacterium TMPK1]
MSASLLLVAALACPAATEPPKIEIELIRNEPAIRRDLNVLQLSRKKAGVGAPTLVPRRTVGLTEGRIRVEPRIFTETLTSAGDACLRPTSVHIEMRVENTIYVAREFTDRPCHTEQILRHEREHVAIDRRLAEASVDEYRVAAEAALAQIGVVGPVPSRNLAASVERMRSTINFALQVVTKRLFERREAAQNAFDTPEEYARVAAACGRKL